MAAPALRRDLLTGLALLAAWAGVIAWRSCLALAAAYPAGDAAPAGLAVALLLVALTTLIRPASAGAGVAAGLLAAAGVTTIPAVAPLFVALVALALAEWVSGGERAAARLQGLGVGALVGLAAAKGLAAGPDWGAGGCDAFAAASWRACLALGFAPLGPALLDGKVTDRSVRSAVAAAMMGGAGAAAWLLSPACFLR